MEDFSSYNGEGTVLRKAQYKMLDILVVVDEICEKHNIPYWIDYGSLLGAVRHGGFIPWDDDLDISLLRHDFKRLSKILKKELPNDLAYQDWKTERVLGMKSIKIRDKHSYYNEGLYSKGEMEYQGIFLDIFCKEEVPSNNLKKIVDYFYGRGFRHTRSNVKSMSKKMIGYWFYAAGASLIPLARLMANLRSTKRIGNTYAGLNLKCIHTMDDVFPLKKINFEGKMFNCPHNTDQILTNIYGDYMRIPSSENRLIHAESIEFFESDKG